MNVGGDILMWVHRKSGMSQIVQKLYSVKIYKCSYLAVIDNGLLNRGNNECEWWSMNVSASKIWNESNHTKNVFNQNKQMHLPWCDQLWYIKPTKQWMWVISYEYECIKNMVWVESYKNCIILKQENAHTFLFPTMVYWINKTNNVIDQLWMWVNWNYEMSQIVRKLYLIF